MFGKILSSLGGVLGQSLGGGLFTTIGRFAGRAIGRYLEEKNYDTDEYFAAANLRENLYQISATAGKKIPIIFGRSKVTGQVIWSQAIEFEEVNDVMTRYFEFSGAAKSRTHHLSYRYYLTFAVAICEGEIDAIERIWANGELVDISNYKYTIYHGSEEQMPNPIIAANCSFPRTPAFRGLAYIIFERLPLEDFGGIVPIFSFEVLRMPKADPHSLEHQIKGLNVIPGSGEFVYDTEIIYKQFYLNEQLVKSEAINCNNHYKIADSIANFQQLTSAAPNLEWASPVVCWFGDSLDIAECNIMPRVEYNDPSSNSSIEWAVSDYRRHNTPLISKDEYGNPNYGGTVNDTSLLRYIDFLHDKGLKIMLYPMFFMDLPAKPWRGHVTGSFDEIERFFLHSNGYRNFILHYANLVKGKIDAFVIGSELIGLTSIQLDGVFPAVQMLCALAEEVKAILGPEVVVTYAADWSEYHHTEGGWYHMDELWTCDAIDCVSIDAYFPLTDVRCGDISNDEIIDGLSNGHGVDYYYEGEVRHNFDKDYAWKNIEHWWKNEHINPNGEKTLWQPRLKKIWFTECGFPSIDKATNQPNVFWDPKCVDGGVPKASNGLVDFDIQRRALTLGLKFWQNQEYIENVFVWCWDARPYPAWPHGTIWSDGYLWQKGHWLNYKLSICSLASIITELALRSNLPLSAIDVDDLHTPVYGVYFLREKSFWNAIDILRFCYQFDVYEHGRQLIFAKRHLHKIPQYNLQYNECILLKDQAFYQLSHIDRSQSVNSLSLRYVEVNYDYKIQVINTHNESEFKGSTASLNFPVSLPVMEAEQIAQQILMFSSEESYKLYFRLPLSYIGLMPTNIIKYQCADQQILYLRITDIDLCADYISCAAVAACTSYDAEKNLIAPAPSKNVRIINEFEILTIPLVSRHIHNMTNLYIYYDSNIAENILVKSCFYSSLVARHNSAANSGVVVEMDMADSANPYYIDRASRIVIYTENWSNEFTPNEVNNGSSLIYWQGEVLRYYHCEKIADNQYVLSHLTRGEFCTEGKVNAHSLGSKLYLIKSLDHFLISNNLQDQQFEITPQGHAALASKMKLSPQILHTPIAPKIHKYQLSAEGVLSIELLYRNRQYDDFMQSYYSEYKNIIVGFNDSDNTQLSFPVDEKLLQVDISEMNFLDNIMVQISAQLDDGMQSTNAILNIEFEE